MTREQRIAKAEKLHAEGLTYQQIADRLGVHHQTAYRWLKPEYAEACRKRCRDYRQIEAWWAEGLTQREIAERLGTSVGSVNVQIHHLREAGYHLPYRYPHGHKFPEQVAA